MNEFTRAEMLDSLPPPVKERHLIPLACSRGIRYPNVVLRNDGFDARTVYTLENFYSNLSMKLANAARMITHGIVLQSVEEDQKQAVNIWILNDARRQALHAFTETAEGIVIKRVPAASPSVLHTSPEQWSFEGVTESGTKVKACPLSCHQTFFPMLLWRLLEMCLIVLQRFSLQTVQIQ